MVANIARGAAVLLLLSAVGCGGGGDTGTTSGASGGGGAGGGGAGGGSGGGPVEVKYPFGFVQLESSVVDGFPQTFAQGAFQTKETAGCVVTTMGACEVTDCQNAKSAALVSAGKLTVTGGDSPITLAESPTHVYSFDAMNTTWSSGAKLTLKAAGDTAPMFSIQGTAPASITVSKPSFDDQAGVTVDRSQDLELAWSKTSGMVQVLLVRNPDKKVSLNCTFDGGSGKATVPSTMLGKITATPQDDWSMVIHTVDKTVQTEGDWTVELEITQFGKTPQGASSGGPVTVL